MEKRGLTIRDYLFMVAGVVVIVCMFLNWFPVELDLGIIQVEEVMGRINGFTFAGAIRGLEEELGIFAAALQEAFSWLKPRGAVLLVFTTVTVIAYVAAIVLRILQKEKCLEMLSAAASIFAVITSYLFCMIVRGIFDALDIAEYGINTMTVIGRSPCILVALAGIVSVACTDFVADAIVRFAEGVIAAVVCAAKAIAEWIKVIVANIGYIVADLMGALVGVGVGKLMNNALDSTILAVLIGIIVAGITAFAGMVLVCRVILRRKTLF